MPEAPKSENAARTREGWDAPLATPGERAAAVEAAFDYRGDVTITAADGRAFEGYVFDRRADASPPVLRLMLAGGGTATLRYDELARLHFTGRDTAVGRSWETWVKKYINKKLAGEHAALEPVDLDK